MGLVHPVTRRALWLAPFAARAQYEESRGETPWVPTPSDVIATMLRLAKVTARDTLYDPGCGDGRIVVAAAKLHGARGVGIDIEPERIREAKAAARQANVHRRVKFIQQDFHHSRFHPATVVAIYLYTRVMAKLKPKLLAELKPGTRIVAHQFNGFGDWQPDTVNRDHHYPVFLWTVR